MTTVEYVALREMYFRHAWQQLMIQVETSSESGDESKNKAKKSANAAKSYQDQFAAIAKPFQSMLGLKNDDEQRSFAKRRSTELGGFDAVEDDLFRKVQQEMRAQRWLTGGTERQLLAQQRVRASIESRDCLHHEGGEVFDS